MTRNLTALIAVFALLVPAAMAGEAESDKPDGTVAAEEEVLDFEQMMLAIPLFEDDWDRPGIAGDLGLSEAQFAKILTERKAFEDERDRLVGLMRSEIRCMRECFKASELDREKLQGHSRKMRELRDKLFDRHTQYLIAVREIVSADQFQKMQRKGPKAPGKAPTPWN